MGTQKSCAERSNSDAEAIKIALRQGRVRAGTSAIVFVLGACATFVETRVEDTIRAELPRLIGPAERYEVDVSGARVSGEIADLENVHAVGIRINRPKAPVIDRLEIDMRNVVVDRKEKQLKSLSVANAQASLLAADIAVFLEAKPGLNKVSVTLYPPYEITVKAQPSIAGYALPKAAMVKMRGRLVAEANELNLEVIDLRAAGFPVGTIPKIVVERAINPIIDLSALPVPSQIASVKVTEDAVVVAATGRRALTVADDAPAGKHHLFEGASLW